MSAAMSSQVVVNGFTVIPVKFTEKSQSCHYLYLKDHNVRESDTCKPRDKTLFVLNVPPYCNKESLERMFCNCGKIEQVYIQKKPSSGPPPKITSKFFGPESLVSGFKVAYIVFKKSTGVKNARCLPFGEARILSTEENSIPTGMEKWCQEYKNNTTNIKELQTEIDKWMKEFDHKKEEEKQKEKEMEGVPDEEGWVTVGSQGRNKGAPRTHTQHKKINIKEKKKRKQKELLNFYTFQMRESKREHIAKLRQKFEEDKQRIQLMRAARKFKPY